MAIYTVSFRQLDGFSSVSRFFGTIRAARKWAAWLLTLPEISEVSVYRGECGGELIEHKAK